MKPGSLAVTVAAVCALGMEMARWHFPARAVLVGAEARGCFRLKPFLYEGQIRELFPWRSGLNIFLGRKLAICPARVLGYLPCTANL